MAELLFIYGTLLPGLSRHGAMAGAAACGAARCEGLLFDLGDYPGLHPGPGQVLGELYEVDAAQLARLDLIEEYDPADLSGSLYLRERVAVQRLAAGGTAMAWTYVYNGGTEGCPLIAHGDYRRHLRERGA